MGGVYDGQFEYGKLSGQGKMVWNTGQGMQTYEGSYSEDLKHGPGTMVWADGRVYDGQWVKGQRYGRGLFINAKGQKQVGNWIADKFEGNDDSTEREETKSDVPLLREGSKVSGSRSISKNAKSDL